MSLKKKSVLGLSYLTVALLGASVLMFNPVSADEENEHTVHTQTKDMPAWERGKEDGWEKGWIDGNKPESTSPYDLREIEVPQPDNTPYDDPGMESDKEEYLQEYNDLYPAGYTAGYKAKMEKKEEMGSNSNSESSEESSDGNTEQKELTVEAINKQDLSTDGAVITTGNGFGIMSTIVSIIEWFRSLF